MIRLLLSAFSELPSNDTGGANKIIYQILNGINYRKYNVEYLSKHLYRKFTEAKDLDLQVISSINFKKKIGKLLFYSSNLYRNFVLSPLYFQKYLKSIDNFYENLTLEKEYDVLHSHDTRAMYYLKKGNTRKKILTIHSDGSIINTIKNYVGSSAVINKVCNDYLHKENESLAIADLITFPSKASRDLFVDEKYNVKIEMDKIKIVYNGVDTSFIKNIKVEEGYILKYISKNNYDIKILNVAAHVNNKNIDKVIDSIYYLKKKYDVRAILLNAGSGPETNRLLSKCEQLKITDQVKFLGRISSIDVIKLLKSTDILVSAADRVVFDMIILEALAAGTIIIASNRGGNSEAIENGINGCLVDHLGGEAFGEAIMKIDKSIGKRALLSSKRFDISEMINEYEKCYIN